MPERRHRIWPVERAVFDPLQTCSLRHDYHEHPLLQLGALEKLAHRLMPHGNCRFAPPDVRPDSAFLHEPRPHDGRTLDQVFRQIETPGSWIALYEVQTDPEYRVFLDEVGRGLQPILGSSQTIFDVRGFVFISAPPSVTPFHIDRENNFWLQIRGRKKLYLWDWKDRSVVAEPTVEKFILFGALDEVRMKADTMSRATCFDCGPGDGAYFPSTTPHMTESGREWVTETDPLTISMGMVFYTDVTRRYARNYALNWQLRRLGVKPKPPGQSSLRDRLKAPVGATMVRLRQRFRALRPPPGIL